MRITGIELTAVQTTREMGSTKPADPFKARSVHVVICLYTDEDVVGIGEMSDINWPTDRQALENLRTRLEAILVGGDVMETASLQQLLNRQRWDHQVLCGIDIAIFDAKSRYLSVPLYQLFGGRVRDRIPFAYPLAPCRDVADIHANLSRVESLLTQGHTAVRYYFGKELKEDERFLLEMRRRWGGQVDLVALDASGGFTLAEALEVTRHFSEFNPRLFESPLRGRHEALVGELLALKAELQVAISEHVPTFEIAARLASSGAVDVFNTGLGYAGISACNRVLSVAEVFGIGRVLGSTVEMSIGTAARAHLAASVPDLFCPCYMAGPLVFDEDVVASPVVYEEGYIRVPEGPGLGVDLDRRRMVALQL